MKYLVELEADIHAENDSATCLSAENGHLDIVKCLIEHGANIHANDYPLRKSTENGHFEIIKYLVELGANVNADDGHSLKWAIFTARLDIAMYLVHHGANFRAPGYAIRSISEVGFLEFLKYFKSLGAVIYSVDSHSAHLGASYTVNIFSWIRS